MQPANLPLDIYRGDSLRMQVKLYAQDNTPIGLNGAVAKAEIRDRPAGDTIIPLQCTITLPNIVNLELAPSDSFRLPVAGVWDLQITFTSGAVQTVLAGQVTVTPDVTDSTPYPQQLS